MEEPKKEPEPAQVKMDGASWNVGASKFIPKGKAIFQKDEIGPSILDLEDESPKLPKNKRGGKKKPKVAVSSAPE